MSHERRLHPRKSVNWTGHVTICDGPQERIRVLDVSAGGARLRIPSSADPRRNELLELTAFRRFDWLGVAGGGVTAFGRVVRVAPAEDSRQYVTVAVRFHTPLRQAGRLRNILKFPLAWAAGAEVAPSA